MPHYHIDTHENGSIRGILRDGEPQPESVSLEQLFSIVTLYFKLAGSNLQLLERADSKPLRRAHGVQAFIMSLTGVEAFTNTYFKLRGQELGDTRLEERVSQRHGSLTRKIEQLMAMTPEGSIEDQTRIIGRIHGLSQLRNDLVHPQWEPASMTLGGNVPIKIEGLVRNFQAAFEDALFCREALMWCLLLVARVGKARGNADLSPFLFHWTGIYGLTEAQILSELGLA
ncbi:hypothetical protein [Sphingomonas phyllosphaerae]|uniref:hypothetical protein n=1 Tax=Sphingomonas phyllosphaerae TaxID=257003 RepID=UPI000490FE51|nr:hypothetical protein [Sphingomonas phyllosphaerae]